MASANEIRFKDNLTGKTIFYNGDFRPIYLISELAGCCKPYYISFHIRMSEEHSLRIIVDQAKEQELLSGLDNKDFKIEHISHLITKSDVKYEGKT